MDKGKVKKGKKYLSIMLVPHYSGKVKALRFSLQSARILALILITGITVFVAYLNVTISNAVAENKILKENIQALTAANSEQQKLLEEKVEKIDELVAFENSIDDQISDIAEKYREMADTYVSNRIEGNIASRSGNRDEQRQFVSDISELKDILTTISEINNDTELSKVADLTETEKKLKDYLNSVPTAWPVSGKLGDGYGYRIHPVYKRRIFHEGVDISAPYGTSIRATASGTVKLAQWYGGYGNTVIIDHGYGISTLYGHASKLLVKAGQKVNKGDIIAKVGSTGVSTGPHVHYEIHLYGSHIDPMIYMESR
jgi:murein DD-endopeptidase MepM/ murein hydrolase activator NlpD